jgi:hypothetical protein
MTLLQVDTSVFVVMHLEQLFLPPVPTNPEESHPSHMTCTFISARLQIDVLREDVSDSFL